MKGSTLIEIYVPLRKIVQDFVIFSTLYFSVRFVNVLIKNKYSEHCNYLDIKRVQLRQIESLFMASSALIWFYLQRQLTLFFSKIF